MKKKINILVVDDLEENRYLLESALKGKEHYQVITACNGKEALEALKSQPIDLIASDILMPVMDGFQFCRECKSNDQFKDIPFVFLTATYTDKKDEEFALSLGAQYFLPKPLEPKAILTKFEEILKSDQKKDTKPKQKYELKEEAVYLKQYSQRVAKKLEHMVNRLREEIVERQKAESDLKESESSLRQQKKTLVQKNMALKEILDQIEQEKQMIKDDVMANIDNIIMPSLEKLKCKRGVRKYVNLIESYMEDLASSFGTKITKKSAKLTSREIEICSTIKTGLANKEISSLLNISLETVEKHRRHIRKKLGITNKDINLTTYLKCL